MILFLVILLFFFTIRKNYAINLHSMERSLIGLNNVIFCKVVETAIPEIASNVKSAITQYFSS